MVILRVIRGFFTRIRMLTDEYFSSSSIHGMQYLAASKRSPFEKVFWILIFVGSISACTILSQAIYRKWQQTPVIIAINERMTPIWEIPFPAITICPEVHNYSASEFRVECVYYAYPYKECEVTTTLVGEMPCATFNVLSASQMFYPEVIANVTNYRYLREITEVSSWNLELGYNNSNHIPSYPVRAFRIGTLHGVSVVIQQRAIPEVNRHRPNTTASFQIILHVPNEYPQSSNVYYEIPANQDGELHITPHMTTTSEELEDYLPSKRQCYYQGERKLKYFQHYTVANCELESIDNYITQYCGCAMFPVPGRDNITACSVGREDSYCWMAEQEDIQYSMSFDRIHLYPKPEDDCLPACTSISYDADVTVFPTKRFQRMENSITTTNLWLGFRTPQFVAWKRRELFSETDLIASIGGLVGLFIGASLLSAVELIYFCTVRLWMVPAVRKGGSSSNGGCSRCGADTSSEKPPVVSVES
ncbi:AAEL000917-PA [Aedes aegypti]|uniref:AAEL000917-PA n=1 Tax=Aedes aegypti TaxID=7159 RepID=Q17MX4_AEDAE|nr:AAEL000917-PA [Aedes aegypti]